nr:recombinase family protein [Pedobacter panaciterrae]
MKIADLYIRVSTDEQADKGFSQRHQKETLLKYCDLNSIKIRNIIYEDYSAKTFIRPEWKKLIVNLTEKKDAISLILFTKWDRFSRNAAEAYLMIKALKQFGVEPQAIEQQLDLTIPENKLMLALYLATPEIENDRRSLNVKEGIRQAKKEGRWIGVAPPGYVNKTRENGTKYIAITEPEASNIKWAFQKIAEDIYTVSDIWKMAKQRGLKSSLTSFRDAIKNIGYCGKVLIPANKDEDSRIVQGQHDAIISEALFYKVQEVLAERKNKSKTSSIKAVSKDELPLRGFMICPRCNHVLTGSASKGSKKYFHYYHCNSTCGFRYPADKVNIAFINKLKQFIPLSETEKIFKNTVLENYENSTDFRKNEIKEISEHITNAKNRIQKARDFLLNGTIDANDFKIIKTETEVKIHKLESSLEEIGPKKPNETNEMIRLTKQVIDTLKIIDITYQKSDIQNKRKLISSIFPEKWVFDGTNHQINNMNPVLQLILMINSSYQNNESRVKSKIRDQHGSVLQSISLTKVFKEDMKKCVRIYDFPTNF